MKIGEQKTNELIISELKETEKNFKIKFWKVKMFPIFATRYGGNDKKEKRGRLESNLKSGSLVK